MFNLIVARRNCIKTYNFLGCFIHQKSFKKEKPMKVADSSLTLAYLINTCGLSPQSALSASKKITIKTTHNPDLFIETLKSYDFTNAQIAKLLTNYPRLLLWNVENTIKPKLDYYMSLGYSHADLGKFLAANPTALTSSLERRVKPNVELMRSIFLTNQHIIKVVTQFNWLIRNNIKSRYLQIIKTLESYGVCHANIAKLISLNPGVLMVNNEKFAKYVHAVKEFGSNPQSSLFVKAVLVYLGLNPLTWEKKMNVYKSFGLSQKDIIAAFIKYPHCMAFSEDKIRRGLNFFAKEMKWDSSFVLAQPALLGCSLDKRVIPRCLVMKVLASKGFVKNYPSRQYQFLLISNTNFLKEYITKYKDKVPEVLKFAEKLKYPAMILPPNASMIPEAKTSIND